MKKPELHTTRRAIWLLRDMVAAGLLLLFLLVIFVYVSSLRQEDRLLLRQAELSLAAYVEENPEVLLGNEAPPFTSRWFSVHLGEETLPEPYRDLARTLADGAHQLEPSEGIRRAEEYMLVARDRGADRPRLYLLYDVRELNEEDESFPWVLVAGGFGVLVMCAVGVGLLARWTRHYLRPVSELRQALERTEDPGLLAAAFTAQRPSKSDNVEELRSSLEASMSRIDQFVQRERQFSRNASHELRTPVTVIRGAAELLERSSPGPQSLRSVRRIQRAVADMENLIATFLYIAREEIQVDADSAVELEPLVREVVDRHRHVLGDRPVEVDFHFSAPVALFIDRQVLSVLLANLIRNAFASTAAGQVLIEADETAVRVSDTGPGLPAHADIEVMRDTSLGRGFGLTIVEELCERVGWTFELSSKRGGGALATLRWPARAGLVGNESGHGQTAAN